MDEHLTCALPHPLPRGYAALCGLLVLVGIVAFAVSAHGATAGRAWGALLVNLMFFMGLAEGGVIASAVIRVAKGNWGRSISRIAEGLASFLPIAFVLLVLVTLLGSRHLYTWIAHPTSHNAGWLQLPFWATRDILAALILFGLSLWYVYLSVRPDLYVARDRVPERLQGFYGRLTRGFRGVEAEVERTRRIQRPLAVVLCLVYALVFTLLSFDLVMSLDPEWASALFGAHYFMGCLYTTWATVWVLALFGRRRCRLGDYITTGHFQDLGKLTFAWCMIWTYLFWSQFLPIWYANMPEEAHFVFLRVHGIWEPVAWTVLTCCFLLPFPGMMTKRAKTWPPAMIFFAAVILAGVFLERFLLVMPAVSPGRVPVGVPEIGITLGVAGLFLLSYGWFTATFPVMPIADPPVRMLHHVWAGGYAPPPATERVGGGPQRGQAPEAH